MRPYSSDPFRDNQQAAALPPAQFVRQGGQKTRSQFGAKPTLANTGIESAIKAMASRRAQEEQGRARQALAMMGSRAHALSQLPGSRLIVPGRVTGPIGSSQLIPTLFNINRLGRNYQPAKPPRIGQHRIDARAATKFDDETGIVIYGRELYTHKSVPLLIIKTRLISKHVQTEMAALSNDVIVHKAVGPILIDLSRYDYLRDIKSSDLPDWMDAYVVNAGGDFAFLGGMGWSIQLVIILKGKDQGIYIYPASQPNANFGLSLSAGLTSGIVDFNDNNSEHSKMSPATFSGNSQGWNAGYGPVAAGITTAYVDGKRHTRNMFGLDQWDVEKADILYRAYMYSSFPTTVPTELKFGVQYSFSKSKLYEWGSFPFNKL